MRSLISKSVKAMPLVLALLGLLSATAFAAGAPVPVTSTELIEHAPDYDGQEVVFTGEVVGEAMFRGDHAWLNASDVANAIGLWTPAPLASQVKRFGTYRNRGATVTVVGVFHRACPVHGGDLDIHVGELTVVDGGAPLAHPVSPLRIFWAICCVGLAAVLGFLSHRRERGGASAGGRAA